MGFINITANTSYNGHLFLDLEQRKNLIMEHQIAAKKGDEESMKMIEYALNDSEPETTAELCAKGEYEKALDLMNRKMMLYNACAKGTILFSEISELERSERTTDELKAELTARGRSR